jgi:hypothetical protein
MTTRTLECNICPELHNMVYTISVLDIMFVLHHFFKAVHIIRSFSDAPEAVIKVDAPLLHIMEKTIVNVVRFRAPHILLATQYPRLQIEFVNVMDGNSTKGLFCLTIPMVHGKKILFALQIIYDVTHHLRIFLCHIF